MKTLFVTIALAIATPALAWDNPLINPFNDALQNYQVDQRLNELARQATQYNQNTFNQDPMRNQPGGGCYPGSGAWHPYCR